MANTVETMGDKALLRAIIDGSLSGTFEDNAIITLASRSMSEMTELEDIRVPNCTTINGHAFSGCSSLRRLSFDNVTTIGAYAFERCSAVTTAVLKKPLTTNNQILYAFNACTSLTVADMDTDTVRQYMFAGCTSFKKLILRRTSAISTLVHTASFNYSPFTQNGTGGTLYVPSALITDYQNATNWSTILGYTNNQILPIEGSEYEFYYADGTPIPTT